MQTLKHPFHNLCISFLAGFIPCLLLGIGLLLASEASVVEAQGVQDDAQGFWTDTFTDALGLAVYTDVVVNEGQGWVELASLELFTQTDWSGGSGVTMTTALTDRYDSGVGINTLIPGQLSLGFTLPADQGLIDLNQDGYLDIIFSSYFSGTWGSPLPTSSGTFNTGSYIYWGNAGGYTVTKRTELPTVGANGNAVADLDNDGYLDIVFCNTINDSLSTLVDSYIYWGSSTGYTTTQRTELPTLGAVGCSIADLDNDDHLDLVFSNLYSGTATSGSYLVNSYIYWGDGLRGYTATNRTELPTAGAASSYVVDLDQDGYLDIIFANYRQDGAQYAASTYEISSYIYWGSSTGYTVTTRTELPTIGAHGTSVSDLNSDGYLDIVFSNRNTGNGARYVYDVVSYIYWGRGGADKRNYSSSYRTVLPTIGTYGNSIADLNGDGHQDIVFSNHSNYISGTTTLTHALDSYIYWGTGTGITSTAFISSYRTTLPTMGAAGNSIGDLDNDGDLDIVFSNRREGNNHNINSYIYWGTGSGITSTAFISTALTELPTHGAIGNSTVGSPFASANTTLGTIYAQPITGTTDLTPAMTVPRIYAPTGVITSAAFDGGTIHHWLKAIWNTTLPAGTQIILEVSTSDDGQNWSVWTPVSSGSVDGTNEAALSLSDSRYLRYRATLQSSPDHRRTPILYDVVFLGDYSTNGEATSVAITPDHLEGWDSVSWEGTINSGQAITLQVLDGSGSLIPDTLLPGNSSGFTSSPVDISTIPVTYSSLRLRALLATSIVTGTPVLEQWQVSWYPAPVSVTIAPSEETITAGLSVAYTVTAHAYGKQWDVTSAAEFTTALAAGGSWSGNVYTTGNDGTWTVTATHRGLTDTAELLVDGTAPVISEVNVTSNDAAHFYNPGLTAEGGTVYFNSLAGEGADQTLTVVVTMTEANPVSLTGGTAFGTTPPADTNGADGWQISYDVGTEPGDQTDVPFTVTDIVWLTDQAVIDFIEDNVAPTGTVTAPTGPYVNETQPDFTADADDVTSGVASVLFQYKLSSAGSYTDLSTDTASPYQAVWGSEALADGQTYNLRVVVTDNVGNIHTSEVVTVTCDLTDPESSASSPDYDTAGPIAVDWTASDALSGIDEVLLYVRAEGGSWADSGLPAQSGTSGTFNYTPPADGTYYFQTVATDNAGNQEAVPSGSTGTGDDSTVYDTTAPTGTVTAPTGPYVNETQPDFTADADDVTSGVASVLFQYKLSSAGSYTDLSTDTASPYQAVWGSEELADGQTYNLRVVVTDNAGNLGTSEVVTVTCDLSMPTMEPIIETEGQHYNSAPVFSNFGFDDNEDLDDGWYQMDSYTGTWMVLFTDVSGPSWDDDGWSIPGFDALSEGSHTIYFRASDDVGNEVGSGGEWSWQFYKDTTPPTMEAISEPQGQYYNSAPVFSNFGFDDEQALDAGWYQIDSYSGSWVPLFAAQAGTEWNEDGWQLPDFDSLSEGSHTVYFRARDDAGNEEGENGEWSWQFYKDTTAPTITYTDPAAGGATAWYTADPGAVIDVDFGVAGGSDLDYAQYRVGAGDWQTIFSADRSTDYTDTWAVDWSLLTEGENEISIRVADVAGNLVTHTYSAGSSGFLFRKDSLPPYINTVSVNSSKSSYFYNPGLSEDGGTVYFNSVDGQGGNQVLTVEVTMTEANPLRLDGGTAFGSTPSDTNGADGWSVDYTVASGAGSENGVLFTVTDQGGYTDTATINFIQDNIAPTATVVTPTGTLTSIGVIQGTAADNSGGAGLSQVELQVTDGTNYLQADGSWSTSAVWLTPSGLANWSYDTSGVTWAETSYTIRVRTTDRVGNVGSDESTFTYEAPAGPMRYIYLPLIFRNY